jgi:hypothetical protein
LSARCLLGADRTHAPQQKHPSLSVKRKHADHSRAQHQQCGIDFGLQQDQQDTNGNGCAASGCLRLQIQWSSSCAQRRRSQRRAQSVGQPHARATLALFSSDARAENDLGAERLPDLLEAVPTTGKAAYSRETTIAKVPKRNRIRRIDAADVLELLRRPMARLAARYDP